MISKKHLLALGALLVVPGGFTAFGAWWLLSRCWHKYSRVFTIRKQTYVVCMRCSKKFEYDLKTMKVGKEIPDVRNSDSPPSDRVTRLDGLVGKVKGRQPSTDPDIR